MYILHIDRTTRISLINLRQHEAYPHLHQNDPKRVVNPVEFPLYTLRSDIFDFLIRFCDIARVQNRDNTMRHAYIASVEHVLNQEENGYLKLNFDAIRAEREAQLREPRPPDARST
jgi:hypothetical protein